MKSRPSKRVVSAVRSVLMDDARWHLSITRKDYAQREGFRTLIKPSPECFLGKGVNASDLVTVKVFLRFYRIKSAVDQFPNPVVESLGST